ncbi:MAG: U6 snRNA-associated Sm-like protein LSm6 [archaeon]|nr:U6 snRNA-associated Sm-like protein LSm6 [archaeon]
MQRSNFVSSFVDIGGLLNIRFSRIDNFRGFLTQSLDSLLSLIQTYNPINIALGELRKNMSQQAKKPLNSLQKAVNKEVSVRLKMELEYRGKMINVDPYMNVILIDATEYSGGNPSATYGKIVIRGNNVLFIKIGEGFRV